MRRYLLPLLLLLLAADVGAAAPPPIRGVSTIGFLLAGDTITAGWGYISPGLFATDTASLQWASKALGAATWTNAGAAIKSRGTSAVKIIPQVATGDSVRLCIVVTRVGASPSPTKCGFKYRAPAASGGVDTVILSLSAVRIPVLLPRAPTVCAPGWSCAFQAAAVVEPRFTYARVSSQRDEVKLFTMDCDLPPRVDAAGTIDTGCIDIKDGKILGLIVCTVAVRADGRVVWTATSAARVECRTSAAPLLALQYGSRWAPALPAAGPVVFSVSKGVEGFGITVDQVGSGLSLSLAVRS